MSMYISIGDAVIIYISTICLYTCTTELSQYAYRVNYAAVLPLHMADLKHVFCHFTYDLLIVSEHSCQTDAASPTLTVSSFSYTMYQQFGIFFYDNTFHICYNLYLL